MVKKKSAGILLYRVKDKTPEVFLVHPGGPFSARKDAGSWSIPKGEFTDKEDALTAARREFLEETGTTLSGDFIELKPITQKSGKIVYAWAIEGDFDPEELISNSFEMEWPPGSGKRQTFPETDRGEWFNIATGKEKINHAQSDLIDELIEKISTHHK